MPEGVEVKLSCEMIRPLIQNNVILMAEVTSNSRYNSELPEGMADFIKSIQTVSVRVKNIETRGKFMYWTFSNGWLYVLYIWYDWAMVSSRGQASLFNIEHMSELQQYHRRGGL